MSVALPWGTANYNNGAIPTGAAERVGGAGTAVFTYPARGAGKCLQIAVTGDGTLGDPGYHYIPLTTPLSNAGDTLTASLVYRLTAADTAGPTRHRGFLGCSNGANSDNVSAFWDSTPSGKYRVGITTGYGPAVEVMSGYNYDLNTEYAMKLEIKVGTGSSGKARLSIDGTAVAEDLDCNTWWNGDTNRVSWYATCHKNGSLIAQFDDVLVTTANGFFVGNPWYIFMKKKKG